MEKQSTIPARWRVFGLIGALTLVTGCASAPPSPEITPIERVRHDQAVGEKLHPLLESKLKIKEDSGVTRYLKSIAVNLASTVPELGSTAVSVRTIQDLNKRWESFSLPGGRIYLSLGLLKTMKFENEIAAALGFELAHIRRRDAIDRLSMQTRGTDPEQSRNDLRLIDSLPERIRFFGESGVFDFSEEVRLQAAEAAVDLLYRAGYDPRGLVSLWQRFEEQPARSPVSRETVARLLEKTRSAIALHAPLRNPVVRSQAFFDMQKRIQRL
jgi:beta-barrel assembly-enhancing protease